MRGLTKEGLIDEILKVTDEFGFSVDGMPGYMYCKVLDLLDELEPLLNKAELAEIKRHGVQRGVELISGRSDPRGIPDKCFAVLDGSIVIIQKDIDSYLDIGLELDADEAQEYVDGENRKLRVSKAQEYAMLAGATSGWNLPAAYVSSYLEDGTVVSHRRVSQYHPRVRVVDEDGNEQTTMLGA